MAAIDDAALTEAFGGVESKRAPQMQQGFAEVTRNVTIVGVGGTETALRDAGAPLLRLFLVTGGAQYMHANATPAVIAMFPSL